MSIIVFTSVFPLIRYFVDLRVQPLAARASAYFLNPAISSIIGAFTSGRAVLSVPALKGARLFAEEFQREMARLTSMSARQDRSIIDRLAVGTREIDTLAANMLAAVASPALLKLLGDREAEKARLEGQLSTPTTVAPGATILSHPAVQQLFKEKVGRLREALDAETVRGEAAEILSTLIESVTIYPDGKDGPEAEVVAKVSDLVAFATNDNAAPRGGMSSSMVVVAGTGFEPVTFRL